MKIYLLPIAHAVRTTWPRPRPLTPIEEAGMLAQLHLNFLMRQRAGGRE